MFIQHNKSASRTLQFTLLGSLLFLPAMAFAHHPMGGQTPSTFMQGFLSGIGHPVIGLDHLAFVIAAGVLAWKMAKPMRLLASFIVATAIGSLVVVSGLSLSVTEPLVLLSIALLGASLLRKKLPNEYLATVFFVLAGFFHGCAYGDAVVGAETTPIIAYLIGFAAIQFTIAFAAAQSIALLSKNAEERLAYARMTGAMVFGIAVTYGFEMAESALFPLV